MTFTAQQKIDALGSMLDQLKRESGASAYQIEILKAVIVDLRPDTPKEIGRTLRAMTHQVHSAKRDKAHFGSYDHGTMQTITEALCGRWWPVIERALQQFEKEAAET